MVTIPNTDPKWSKVELRDILYALKKEDMLKISKKFDLYVSPNLNKEKTSSRLAEEIKTEPISVYPCISKTEFPLLMEILEAQDGEYVERKIRKTHYMVQKLGMVLTHEDKDAQVWRMIMPDDLKRSLKTLSPAYKELHEKGIPFPSAKELRLRYAIKESYGN